MCHHHFAHKQQRTSNDCFAPIVSMEANPRYMGMTVHMSPLSLTNVHPYVKGLRQVGRGMFLYKSALTHMAAVTSNQQ